MARTVLFARVVIVNNDITDFQFVDGDQALAIIQRANVNEQVIAMALVNGTFQTAQVKIGASAPVKLGEMQQYDLVVGAQNTLVGHGVVFVNTP